MKIISLLGEAEVGNKASLPIDRDLLYKARQKYPQYSGEQALTLYIADEMKEKDQVDSNQNRLLDTQKRENERLRGVVDNLGQTVEQEIQQVAQQAEINDREISRIKQLTGKLSQGGTDTQRKAKVSSDDLEKLQKDLEMLKTKPGMDPEKYKKLQEQIKELVNNQAFDNTDLAKVRPLISTLNKQKSIGDELYQRLEDQLRKTQDDLNAKEGRFVKYINKKTGEVGDMQRTHAGEIQKYSDIVKGYQQEIKQFDNELKKMQKEKDIIYDLRAGVQQDAEDISKMKIELSQSLDFINQHMDKMTGAETNKNVADINWLVGGNKKPQNIPVQTNMQESITEDYEVAPSRRYNNSKYNEWIHKHFSGLFALFTKKYKKELMEKGYSDRQIADTLEEYVPLLYNLGDDKTPLTPQQVQLWIDNVKLKLWERPVQYEMFGESLAKTYSRMLDKVIGLPYI
jgi:DNA repair exonuclease SbcCD ATPase subunit